MPRLGSGRAAAALAAAAVLVGLQGWSDAAGGPDPRPAAPVAAGARHLAAGAGTSSTEVSAGPLLAGRIARPTPDPTPTPPPAPPPPPRTFTLVATGDVLLHERLWTQARNDAAVTGAGEMDFVPMLEALRPYVEQADLALCHLETPLAPPGGPYAGYPAFAGPPSIVPALDALGYDACTTASNHVFDQGAAGVTRTLDALDAAGMGHAGSARTPAEAARTRLTEIAGVRVALVSATYGTNGIPAPNGEAWRTQLIDVPALLAAAARARTEGAEVVVVSLHWGSEYRHDPDALQLEVAPQVAASPDVDVVIGHHAHVVQPMERLGRTWVAYGLGNLVAAHRQPGEARSEGLLVRFTFTEQPGTGRFEATGAEYLPLLVTDPFPVRVLDVPTALASGAYGSTTAERLAAALARTTTVVESRGGPAAGLRRIGS